MSLLPDIILGLLSATVGDSSYVPMSRLRLSIAPARRRMERGRAISVEVWWTDTRLSPERATVILETGKAVLRRQFQPEAELGRGFRPIEFLDGPLPSNLPDTGLSWLQLETPNGVRYLGASETDIVMIGLCARWPYPSKPGSDHTETTGDQPKYQ